MKSQLKTGRAASREQPTNLRFQPTKDANQPKLSINQSYEPTKAVVQPKLYLNQSNLWLNESAVSPEELEHKKAVAEHPVDRLQREQGRPGHTAPWPIAIRRRKIDGPVPLTGPGLKAWQRKDRAL